MPDITEEKVGKDFMITRRNNSSTHFIKREPIRQWLLRIVMIAIVVACSPNLSDDPVPYIPFPTIIITLSLPEYSQLNTMGYQYINDAGVKGIIVYRVSSTAYVAFERNCSYHPNDACATVNVDPSGLYMTDPCCNSTFSFPDGNPSGGVAWRPLRQYGTSVLGNTLTITDDVISE